uniref:HMG box domain-containing protein n=1 Tax=Chaetoceros debilis TaxID=122233 RepID=A0A7S3Q0L2_9STRA
MPRRRNSMGIGKFFKSKRKRYDPDKNAHNYFEGIFEQFINLTFLIVTRLGQDPTAPKKNSSSFLIFCRTRRKAVRQRNPHTENKYIVRMLSEEWNKLTVEEKRPYQEIEMKEREMYLQKMNEWKKKEELKKDMLEREVVASKIKLHTEVLDAPALSQLAQPTPSHEPTPSQKPTPSHEPTPSQKPAPIHEPTPIHHPNTSMMASQ